MKPLEILEAICVLFKGRIKTTDEIYVELNGMVYRDRDADGDLQESAKHILKMMLYDKNS